jgi:hypothetical protein
MIWSAAAGSFGGLLLARLFLGVAAARWSPRSPGIISLDRSGAVCMATS